MSQGFNIAEEGHTVAAFLGTLSTTATGLAANFGKANHVSIIVTYTAAGSPPAAPSAIQVNQCTDANGDNAVAMANGFRYYYQTKSGAGNDVLDGNQQVLPNSVGPGPNWTSSNSGITSLPVPSGSNAAVVIIEMDSPEMEIDAQSVGSNTEHPYVQCVVTGTQSNVLSIVYEFSMVRTPYKGGQSFTV